VHEKNAGKVDLAAEVPAIAKGESGISVDKERRIRARSDKPVVYGVELNQLVYDEKRKRFDLAEARNRIHTRAVPEALGRAMIGGENDSMVIELEE
jgi:hypothetical protein